MLPQLLSLSGFLKSEAGQENMINTDFGVKKRKFKCSIYG